MSHSFISWLYGKGEPLSPILFEFAEGHSLFKGASTVHKFGYNDTIGATEETIWSQGGLYVFPSIASSMNVSSDVSTDTSAGVGARSVVIQGLNADYDEVNETVTLNGLTEVATTNEFFRINRMYTETAGSADRNEGNIYIGLGGPSSGVPTTVYGKIDYTENQTLQAIYTVPRNNVAYITHYSASVGKGGQAVTVKLRATEGNTSILRTRDKFQLLQGNLPSPQIPPTTMVANSDMMFTGASASGSNDVTVSIHIIKLPHDWK